MQEAVKLHMVGISSNNDKTPLFLRPSLYFTTLHSTSLHFTTLIDTSLLPI